ncbi:MAG: hypothetical protein IKC19_01775 [Bacteroidales bacterium]|nr:hypothetical protein [Bacteroidales bacterium]
MKKVFLASAVVLVLMVLTSCGQKRCFCYERTGAQVYESEIYINPDTPCSSQTTNSRGCIEEEERGTIDPGMIANPGPNAR